jgi:hypothetical protein
MKKLSIWSIAVLLVTFTIPAIGWVSTTNSDLDFFDLPTESNTSKTAGKTSKNKELFSQYISSVYVQAKLSESGLDESVFEKALIGYYNLKKKQVLSKEKAIITIIDFSKRSSMKRLWIVDINQNKLLFNTLVAHGQGSGLDMATNFSNKPNSHQSSLGFYVTSETYLGKHGLSMKLDGMDTGFNTNARDRAVVVHGAKYVSQSFVNQTGRLGRSHGCPAIPIEFTKTIINTIKGQTCLFINGPEAAYTSNFLDQDLAIANFMATPGVVQASIY